MNCPGSVRPVPFHLGGGELLFILILLLLLSAPLVTWRRGGSAGRVMLTIAVIFIPVVGWLASWVIALTTRRRKKCPQCAEFVPREAHVCIHCQYRFVAAVGADS